MTNTSHSCREALLWSLSSGLLMGVAWLTPGTLWCAVLGWCAVVCLVRSVTHPGARYWTAYTTGLLQNTIGFYWIAYTAQEFGGFPQTAAFAVLGLFVVISSLQNIIFFFLFRHLPTFLDRHGTRAAAAWVTSEVISPRVFPWFIGHTQLAFPWLAICADISGVLLISFLMLVVADAASRLLQFRVQARALSFAGLLLGLTLGYGYLRSKSLHIPDGMPLDVSLMQANISTERKGNVQFFKENRDRYERLTKSLDPRPELVVWPETVVQDFIYDGIERAEHDPNVPYFPGKHLLTGALTYRSKKEVFNSALSVFADGRIPPPYHKQILMPFGEFMPLSSTFPWLQDLNPIAQGLTAGTSTTVQEYPALTPTTPEPFRIASLICYEDVMPSLSREAAQKGAQLLVNLTNDAWFGASAAPYQHHLIASFRAIETRRYLLRATNSGYTAIVDPIGRTIAAIPTFAEGSARAQIYLKNDQTPYVTFVGEIPWWTLGVLTLGTAVWGWWTHRNKSQV